MSKEINQYHNAFFQLGSKFVIIGLKRALGFSAAINKAAGPGENSIRLIKSYKLAIAVHLQFALNECNMEKIFPTKIKVAYATPFFEDGDKLDSTNYRPNSVTPSFGKFFERLLLTQKTHFNDKHKIINKEQFGFQKKSQQQMQF